MTLKSINLTEDIYNYLLSVSLRETPVQKALREETARHPQSMMQIAPEQGQFMTLLLRLINARKVMEIGVFTGYGTLAMARGIPDDGKIIACDINKKDTAIAKKFWSKAGVSNKITLELAPALDTMSRLIDKGHRGTFDFVFIDADKPEYPDYYKLALELIRTGGLIMVDNVLWSGKPASPAETDRDTLAIRDFNAKLHEDERIFLSMLPVADGITLAVKI
jgi:predicted O-methyltransferase YrrM